MNQLQELYKKMVIHNAGDPKRIQHSVKVHSFAKWIGEAEGLDIKTQKNLEAAAILHDIGIKVAEEKYGSCNGKLQEQEGPAVAKELLEELGFESEEVERICYLIAHHHTYTKVEGIDYRILLEADFLVNLYEDGESREVVEKVLGKIFETKAGKELCQLMFFN